MYALHFIMHEILPFVPNLTKNGKKGLHYVPQVINPKLFMDETTDIGCCRLGGSLCYYISRVIIL